MVWVYVIVCYKLMDFLCVCLCCEVFNDLLDEEYDLFIICDDELV